MKIINLFIAVLVTVIITGCSKNDMNPTESAQEVLITDPGDNSAAVRLDKQIQLSFAKPVDRAVVEKNFHLINEKMMMDSACIYGKNMMHGSMSMVMMDSSKMNHFINDHYTPGSFEWNAELTQCTFTPDSLLEPNTEYMMHFGDDMIQMMDERMGDMMDGGMMGGGQGNMGGMGSGQMMGHMIWHFTTMDTTTGSGHSGHH